ncbi:hypothetical protein LTR35_013087 [Friedmanniomyces endolithicus]|uniref:Uncharacterized protein n=1 Tax=Friedmanniomyces endolithicus TaxID=329885 RepID=A0AAN6J6Q5_9PEZI|nr:hypothetical protein LTR35_013087 [Friedmanniomyces endolithicus]KAK0283008.1 hypothetical protein LTS00_011833 [Friedmanniomyces endolithicus]KAK0314428.1 hypothetical protein LTR01_001251 [Friedmanniomyces endolithicus]KAK0318309.1 hypothetical protein LTR82_010697 [Friedmanniomyces endolithicus]KAK0827772.1 hypothetical protein LTR73_005374 [Friedmanniomyces endolithicus]
MDAATGRFPFFHIAKRSYAQMSDSHLDPHASSSSSSLFLPYDDHYNNEHTTRRPRLALPPMRASPARFAGDGLDLRRPVMGNVTSAAAPVIDLTEEYTHNRSTGSVQPPTSAVRASRLPRFGGRDIVDLQSEEGEHSRSLTTRQPRPQFSQLRRPARIIRTPVPFADIDDDLEIVSERTLSRQTSAVPVQRSITPFPADLGTAPFVDLTEDDDVVLVSARQREVGVNAARPGGLGEGAHTAHRAFGLGGIAGMLQQGGRLAQRLGLTGYHGNQHDLDHDFLPSMSPPLNAGPNEHVYRLRQAAAFPPPALPPHPAPAGQIGGLPGALGYGDVGFNLGLAGGNRPQSPKYEPPSAPSEGFTRNPGEDETVVCPNCGDELAVCGDEIKQEVWVVKGCGHAYCGTCARHRSKSAGKKRGKGKERVTEADAILPAPFSKCVIEGCGKNTRASQMVRVYFGS